MPEIKTTEPVILAYGVPASTPEGARLRELAAEKGIAVRDVTAAEFSRKLGEVAGLPGFEETPADYTGEEPTHSILWFVSVDRSVVNWLLQQYSISEGVKSIDLKSVLTEMNVNWTLESHYKELQLEHRMMQAYTFLIHAPGAFEALDEDDYTFESFNALELVVMETDAPVKAMQEGKEVRPEVLEDLVSRIKAAFQGLVPKV